MPAVAHSLAQSRTAQPSPIQQLNSHQARWLLVAVGTGSFMSGLDSSISNTVLPVIAGSLHADVAAAEGSLPCTCSW
jgi:hypothetical protein